MADTPAEDASASGVWAQLGPYLGYVGYFVGAGLISGGIVHYTLDPARYLKVAVAGVVVFLVATVLNEIVLPKARLARGPLLRIVGGSLLLSLGIGMFSGGIQHFSDFPARSATLVPAGLVLSFLAFPIRNAVHVRRAGVSRVGAGVLVLAAGLYFGLHMLAGSLVAEGEAGHSHGAATAETGTAGAGTGGAEGADPAAHADHGGVHQEVAPTGGDADSTEDVLKDLADIQARLTTLRGAAG